MASDWQPIRSDDSTSLFADMEFMMKKANMEFNKDISKLFRHPNNNLSK